MTAAAVLLMSCVLAQAQTPPRDAPRPTIAAAGAIAGVVLSDAPEPRPLRRALVTVSGAGGEPNQTTITADDGTFAFEGLAPGRYTLTVAKEPFISTNDDMIRSVRRGAQVEVTARRTSRVTFRLARGAVITGVVTDPTGVPVEGAPVHALKFEFNGRTGERRLVPAGRPASLSDDRGVYRIYALPAGDYLVAALPASAGPGRPNAGGLRRESSASPAVAMAPVFFPSTIDAGQATRVRVAAGEERGGIDIQTDYARTGTIAGVAVPGAEGTISRTGDPLTEVSQGRRAGPDGRFTFAGLWPGRYRLFAQSQDGMWGAADVALDGSGDVEIAMSMSPAFAISGRVVFEGDTAPVELALRPTLPLVRPAGQYAMRGIEAQVEPDGRFTIANLAPGVYRQASLQGVRTPIGRWWLKSILIGGRELLDAPLEIRGPATDAVVTLSDRASELTGIVRDAAGEPVRDAYVVAFSADRAGWFFNSRRVAGVRPDRDGRYMVRNLPPGEYRVALAHDIGIGEWFDPSVLDRLLPSSTAVSIAGVESQSVNLTIR